MPRVAVKTRGIYERPPKSGVWWISYFDSEKKRRREKGGSRSNALTLLKVRKGEKVAGVKLPDNLRNRGLLFGSLIDGAIEHSQQNNGERTTHELELKYAVIREEFGKKIVAELTKPDFMRWLGKQAKLRSWSPGTQNRWQAALSLTFRVAMMSDVLDRNPLALAQRKRESDGRTRYLDYAEEALLRGIVQRRCVHNLHALDIALHTGIRSGEQFSIRWWQVDLERKLLFIPKNLSKNKKGRHVQLNAVALSAFNSLLAKSRAKSKSKQVKPDEHVFLNRSGDPLRGHRDWFDPILKEAKLPDFTWHCLRHTFASRLVMAGVDLRTVGELMGHSSFEMTKRYSHLSEDHKASAGARLEQSGTTSGTGALPD